MQITAETCEGLMLAVLILLIGFVFGFAAGLLRFVATEQPKPLADDELQPVGNLRWSHRDSSLTHIDTEV